MVSSSRIEVTATVNNTKVTASKSVDVTDRSGWGDRHSLFYGYNHLGQGRTKGGERFGKYGHHNK